MPHGCCSSADRFAFETPTVNELGQARRGGKFFPRRHLDCGVVGNEIDVEKGAIVYGPVHDTLHRVDGAIHVVAQ
eukprot:1267270-Pyramimonas_sp.AAC.1